MNLILTSLILIAYELNLFFKLKLLVGYKKHEYKKPFDCFFCLSVWGNSLLLIYTQDLTQWAVAILISKTIDLLWNKN
jgi:lipid-A-disaccharide synthase-like uncharacterized protein